MFFKKQLLPILILILLICNGCSLKKITHQIIVSEKNKQLHIVVVIDVFRAFTTAAYILDQEPRNYILTTDSKVIEALLPNFDSAFLIGKAEKGIDLTYNLPNSPTRVLEVDLKNKNVFHRTAAGAKGILSIKEADIILAAGFVNACATVEYIKSFKNPKVTIIPMGHEGNKSSLEDDLCAIYIKNLLAGRKINLQNYYTELKKGPGKYFFDKDQKQYPKEDFQRCLETHKANFVIKAQVFDKYAILSKMNL